MTQEALQAKVKAASVREMAGAGRDVLQRTMEQAGWRIEQARLRFLPGSAVADEAFAREPLTDGGRSLLVRPALLGFLAILAIVVGASQPSSPFKHELPGAWFFGVPMTKGVSKQGFFFGLVAVYGGLLLLLRVWYGMTRSLARRPGVRVKYLAAVFALWTLPLLIAPPLFSNDVYSYAAQGEMTSHHVNPYEHGPQVLGDDQYASLVDPFWQNTPAPYGPFFLQVDGALVQLSFHHVFPTIVLLRLIELGGVVLVACCIPTLARRHGREPGEIFALAVLNPVTTLQLIGGAHNDALMVGLLVAGITVAKRGRPVAGIVLCTLAAAVKAPAAIGIVYIGWEWLGAGVPWRDRVRPVVTSGIIAAGVLALCSELSGLGWGWIANLSAPGSVRSWLAPATGVGMFGAGALHAIGIGVSAGSVLSLTRFCGLGIAAFVGARLLWRSEKVGSLKAIGLTLLLFVILGPVVQPWYLAWGLILLAPVATGRLRGTLVALSVVSPFIGLPGARQLLGQLIHANPLSIAAAVLVLVAVLAVPLSSRPAGAGPAWRAWLRELTGSPALPGGSIA